MTIVMCGGEDDVFWRDDSDQQKVGLEGGVIVLGIV